MVKSTGAEWDTLQTCRTLIQKYSQTTSKHAFFLDIFALHAFVTGLFFFFFVLACLCAALSRISSGAFAVVLSYGCLDMGLSGLVLWLSLGVKGLGGVGF